MAYDRALWLPDVLRAAGLTVVEHDGWRERGLTTARPFEPDSVVWHHDASGPGDSPGVPAYMVRNFANAGAQIWVDRAGRWHLVASGRAAHAGTVRGGMPTNERSLGVETDHTTGEAWPPVLLESLRVGTAAILRHLRTTAAKGLHFHKSICYPVGRKVDPAGLDLAAERKTVARLMDAEPVDRRPAVSLKRVQKVARRAGWARTFGGPGAVADAARVRRALKAEGFPTYRAFQKSLGFTGDDADGIPGRKTLERLGDRQGFQVKP